MWKTDVDAATPEEAARMALWLQGNSDSTVLVIVVSDGRRTRSFDFLDRKDADRSLPASASGLISEPDAGRKTRRGDKKMSAKTKDARKKTGGRSRIVPLDLKMAISEEDLREGMGRWPKDQQEFDAWAYVVRTVVRRPE